MICYACGDENGVNHAAFSLASIVMADQTSRAMAFSVRHAAWGGSVRLAISRRTIFLREFHPRISTEK